MTMKKVVLTLLVAFIGTSVFAQMTIGKYLFAPQFEYNPTSKKITKTEKPEAEEVAAIEWKNMTHSFGTIDYNRPVTGVFEFVNTSDEPIIIKSAKGSCGCTGTTYPKTAILPGETAKITATYDAKNIGPFKKTVTVHTNIDKEKKGTVLDITGEVIWRL